MTVPAAGLGAVIAIVVLVVAVVLILMMHGFTWPLALIAALAVARLT